MHDDEDSDLHSAHFKDFWDITKLKCGDMNIAQWGLKGILENSPQNLLVVWLSVDGHAPLRPEFKATKVVHSHDVVGMSVGNQHRINHLHVGPEELQAHFWSGVHKQVPGGALQQKGGASSPVLRVSKKLWRVVVAQGRTTIAGPRT